MNDLAKVRTNLHPPENGKVFVLPLKIRPEHIDENGHVNNVVYVGWLQEVGISHWTAVFDAAERAKWSWVALRHEIDYLHPLAPDAEVIARTWVADFHGPCLNRYVRIEDGNGNLCAQGITTWCLLDAIKKRPRRLPQEMLKLFSKYSDD